MSKTGVETNIDFPPFASKITNITVNYISADLNIASQTAAVNQNQNSSIDCVSHIVVRNLQILDWKSCSRKCFVNVKISSIVFKNIIINNGISNFLSINGSKAAVPESGISNL